MRDRDIEHPDIALVQRYGEDVYTLHRKPRKRTWTDEDGAPIRHTEDDYEAV